MLQHQLLDPIQFVRREPEIPRERDRVQPELRREIISVDVNVRRFVRLVTVEIQTVRAVTKNRRHGNQGRVRRLSIVARAWQLTDSRPMPPRRSLCRHTPHRASR